MVKMYRHVGRMSPQHRGKGLVQGGAAQRGGAGSSKWDTCKPIRVVCACDMIQLGM